MKYTIHFNKTINQLVPYYLNGRKLVLFLQALMSPLQQLNDVFSKWARETRIEAAMTSQVFKLEYFLNLKLQQYFSNKTQRITIKNSYSNGTPIYYEHEDMGTHHMVMFNQNELTEEKRDLRYEYEDTLNIVYSFLVYAPRPDLSLVSQDAYETQLKFWIDKYKLTNKNYQIIYL